MKIIYEGQEFKVPKKTKYVAADDDGEVFAYSGPEKLRYSSRRGFYHEGGTQVAVGWLDLINKGVPVRYPAVKIKKLILVEPVTITNS